MKSRSLRSARSLIGASSRISTSYQACKLKISTLKQVCKFPSPFEIKFSNKFSLQLKLANQFPLQIELTNYPFPFKPSLQNPYKFERKRFGD
jgi:hypothetical protein